MPYELVYDKQRYHVFFDEEGEPYDLHILQPEGPSLTTDLSTLPTWLLDKLRDHWQQQKAHEMQQMFPPVRRIRTPSRRLPGMH